MYRNEMNLRLCSLIVPKVIKRDLFLSMQFFLPKSALEMTELATLGALVNVPPQNIDGKLWKTRQFFHNVTIHNICRKCSLFLAKT